MGKVRSKRVRERPWLTENQTHGGEHNFECFILLAPLQNLHYQSLLFYYKSQHKLQLKALALVCYRVLVQAGNSQERKEDADLALSSRLDAASGFGKLPTPISFLSLLTFNQTNGNNKVGHRPGLGFKPAYTRMHNLSAWKSKAAKWPCGGTVYERRAEEEGRKQHLTNTCEPENLPAKVWTAHCRAGPHISFILSSTGYRQISKAKLTVTNQPLKKVFEI